MQLEKHIDHLAEMGINVAAITYDDQETSLRFTRQAKIRTPILRDVEAEHMLRFGILNTDYEPGHRAYGIPYPGMLLVDRDGIVRTKLAEERYQKRPPWPMVLEAARQMTDDK